MKPIEVTKQLIKAVEYYQEMKEIKDMAFTQYCESSTATNAMAHESADNTVQYGANLIANIVENHFKAWDLTPEQEAYYK